MKERIVIIGNGAAGNAALEEIISSKGDYDITVITAEKTPPYYRPMLSEYISVKEIPKRFYLHDHNWYKDNNIKILYGTEVTAIHTDAQTLSILDGDPIAYDKLLLCIGSHNFIPPIPGAELEHVMDLRHLEDAEILKSKAWNSKKAVIIGGGLLGLELGWQLRKLNVEVSVIEMMDRLLPRQLDTEASQLFEKKVLETGIKVIKGVQTHEIYGTSAAEGVKISSGESIDADFVVISIGIRAEVKLAQDAGLLINRGILVNDFMQTNIKNIYAAGDCAEHQGTNFAIWPEAVEQGKIAGLNMIDDKSVYTPVVPFNIYHGMNLRLFSIGDVGGNPANTYEVIRKGDDENFEKYFFLNDKIVGGVLMGNISKSSKLKKGVSESMTKTDFEQLIG